MIFTAQLGTKDSAPGNIALGYQLVTVTNVTDSSTGWMVTLSETLLGNATSSDDDRYGLTINDQGDPG